MRADEQLKASLKEIDDLKAALDQHTIVAKTDSQKEIVGVDLCQTLSVQTEGQPSNLLIR